MNCSPYSTRFLSRFIVKDAYDINDGNKVYPVLFFDEEHVESATMFANDSTYYKNSALKTKRSSLRAVGLFFEFCSATNVVINTYPDLRSTFQCFYDTLISGSMNLELNDFLWPARSVILVNDIIYYAQKYIQYCLDELNILNIHGSSVAAKKCYSKHESYKLFSHLDNQKNNLDALRTAAKYQSPTLNLVKKDKVQRLVKSDKRFPSNKSLEMITTGCLISNNVKISFNKRFNIRNSLLFSMYLFAGLRGSEPLQIYKDDIDISKNLDQLNVQLAHPKYAPIIFQGKKMTRSEYLEKAFKLKPRNELGGTEWAGWKGLEELDPVTKATTIVWIAPLEIKQFMISLHSLYMSIRSEQMKNAPFKHPYYFVAEDGSPLKDSAVSKAWKQACNRVGLTGTASDGQNRHGCRHNIAMLLEELKFPAVVIKTVLHHRCILSQEQYKSLGLKKAQEIINKAFDEVNNGEQDGSKINNEYCKMKTDPKMIFTDLNKIAGIML